MTSSMAQRQTLGHQGPDTVFPVVELRGLEPRTEPGEIALELSFLSFGVVTRVLRFLRICAGVLRDVTVLDRLVWRPSARG
jgi:hypothetical protein